MTAKVFFGLRQASGCWAVQAEMSSDPTLMKAAVKSLWDGRPGLLIMGLRQRSIKEREVSGPLFVLTSDHIGLVR